VYDRCRLSEEAEAGFVISLAPIKFRSGCIEKVKGVIGRSAKSSGLIRSGQNTSVGVFTRKARSWFGGRSRLLEKVENLIGPSPGGGMIDRRHLSFESKYLCDDSHHEIVFWLSRRSPTLPGRTDQAFHFFSSV
jgi:hypothetical protein